MPHVPTDPATSRRMSTQRERDTACELALRRALWQLGYRYRKHYHLPGMRREIDIAFVKPRVAILVDGCFWHSCPEHGTVPRRNREWWQAKLNANVARDRDTDARLQSLGWTVIRLWEHVALDDAVRSALVVLEASSGHSIPCSLSSGASVDEGKPASAENGVDSIV
jgi:DNA mismatch endonuclease (patch repair protein)